MRERQRLSESASTLVSRWLELSAVIEAQVEAQVDRDVFRELAQWATPLWGHNNELHDGREVYASDFVYGIHVSLVDDYGQVYFRERR